MHLAEIAVADALDDGWVEISLVDFRGQSRVGSIGQYQVDPLILEALRNHMAQFRAGVLGPDAYPDLLTGQSVIHPPDERKGSDGWLQLLWNQKRTPAERAFVVGFLAHAAGDMYGHSMVNHYAGGPFTTDPVDNAVIHTLVEGYIAQRTPPPSTYSFSIAGVEDFIYANLVDARRASIAGPLYRQIALQTERQIRDGEDKKEKGTGMLPFMFSDLRDGLEDFKNSYYRQIQFYDEQIAATSFPVDVYWRTLKTGYAASVGPAVTYAESWIDDIDSALRRLPIVSTQLAEAIVYSPSGAPDLQRAEDDLRTYWGDYVLWAVGIPDALSAFQNVTDFFGAEELGPEYVSFNLLLNFAANKLKTEFEGALLEYLKENGLLIAAAPVALLMGNPGAYVETQLAKKQEIDDAMRVQGSGDFAWQRFAAAFNTVTMIKLSLLGPSELQRLMRDLGYPRSQSTLVPALNDIQNAMLGFHWSMDNSVQWRDRFDKMIGHWDCYLYQKMFMNQIGDHDSTEAGQYHYLSFPGGALAPTADRRCSKVQEVIAPDRVCAGLIAPMIDLDLGLDRYYGVTDIAYSGGLQGPPHIFMERTRAQFTLVPPPVQTPQIVQIIATRQNSVTKSIQLVPPEVTGTRIEDDRGNLFAYGRDGRVLGGTALELTVALDCNNTPPATNVSLSVCPLVQPASSPPTAGNLCVIQMLPATRFRQEYGFSVTLPDVVADSDYVITASYLGRDVPVNIRVLAARVKSLSLAPAQVTLDFTPGNNPTLLATLQLASPAIANETVHLEFAGLASATGQRPTADVTVPAGASQLTFLITIPNPAVVMSGFFATVTEGIVAGLSERDPADFPERKRFASVSLVNPTNGMFHGSPLEDPRWEAFAEGCWQLGLPGPGCEPSILLFSEKDSGRVWAVNPRDLGLDAASRFSGRVEFVGDRNSDGVPDLAVSSANAAGPGIRGRSGVVFILSGRTGQPLARFVGKNVEEKFGASLAWLGTDELAVGAPGSGRMAGRVDVVNLRSGNVDRTYAASQPGDRFGSALRATRSGDGASLLVGAPGDASSNGTVFMTLGSSLRPFARGESRGDRFGQSLASTRDGKWFLVGAPGAALSAGAVSVWSETGELRWKVAGGHAGAQLGADVAVLVLDPSDTAHVEFVAGAPGLNRANQVTASNQVGGAYFINMQGRVTDIQRGTTPGARVGEFISVGSQSPVGRRTPVVLSGNRTGDKSVVSFRTRTQSP